MTRRLIASAAASLLALSSAAAQQPAADQPPTPRAAPSTQASVAVVLTGRQIGTRWFPGTASVAGPARIQIDYGQPHARGRTVVGTVVPFDSVWRTGANVATHLTTDVDLTIGTLFVPRGQYTLYTLPTRTGWKLIVNRQTRNWGTEYDPKQDVGRVDLRSRTLQEPLESFTMWLVPATDSPARGMLRMAWERTELTADWKVGR